MAYVESINATLITLHHGLIGYYDATSELVIESVSGGVTLAKDEYNESLNFEYSNSYVKLNESSVITFNHRSRNGVLNSRVDFAHRSRNGLLESNIAMVDTLLARKFDLIKHTNIMFNDIKVLRGESQTELELGSNIYQYYNKTTNTQFIHKATRLILDDIIFDYTTGSINISNVITSDYDFSQLAFPGTEDGFRDYALEHFTSELNLDSIIYVDINTPLHPECAIHGVFTIMPYDMVQLETGCPLCDIHLRAEIAKRNAAMSYDHHRWYHRLRCNNIRVP